MLNLTEKLQQTFSSLKSKTVISQENIKDAIKAVKVSLLEADVNLDVVNKINNNVTKKIMGTQTSKGISAAQEFINIVSDEIEDILGKKQVRLKTQASFYKMMMVGLQGSGKTTTIAKLAKYLKDKENKKVLAIAGDVYRPAAIDQLLKLGKENNFEVFEKGKIKPLEIVKEGLLYAKKNNFDTVIVDTAGRLQIDQDLMLELEELKKELNPQDILLAVDAMSGQELINVAKVFHDRLELTGAIATKTDGDSKGGAILSIKYAIGISIMFSTYGEKVEALEEFIPKKAAKKILGLSDIVDFVKEAKEVIYEKSAQKVGNKIMSGKFNLDDMLFQLKAVQKLGISKFAKMIPGIPKVSDEQMEKVNNQIFVMQALLDSMTKFERKNPKSLQKDKTRKIRIINGSGRNAQEFNKLLTQYNQMQTMAKLMKGNKGVFNNKFNRF